MQKVYQCISCDSEEFGYTLGLDLITGNVKNFSKEIEAKKINIGWQKIELNKLLKDNLFYNYVEANNLLDSYYYFVHSFYAKNIEKKKYTSHNQKLQF